MRPFFDGTEAEYIGFDIESDPNIDIVMKEPSKSYIPMNPDNYPALKYERRKVFLCENIYLKGHFTIWLKHDMLKILMFICRIKSLLRRN